MNNELQDKKVKTEEEIRKEVKDELEEETLVGVTKEEFIKKVQESDEVKFTCK